MHVTSSASSSSTQMEFHGHSSSALLKVEPDLMSCLIKNESQDISHPEQSIKSTWQPESSSIIKSEPKEEKIEAEQPGGVGGSFLHMYLHPGADMNEFLQEDSKYVDASDDITQFGAIALKNNKTENVKAGPEDLKSELTIEDGSPAAEAERLSLEYILIRKDMHQECMDDNELSSLQGILSDSNKKLETKSLKPESPSCGLTLPAAFGSDIKDLESTKFTGSPGSVACNCCSKMFQHKSDLTDHMQRHTREKHYVCSTCNKSFSHIGYLNMHSVIHTRRKSVDCSTCNKSFSCMGHLNVHSRIHTGRKPFVCSTCNKAFTRRDDLKRHSIVHTGVKPFECPICNKVYAQKQNLKTHVTFHHEQK